MKPIRCLIVDDEPIAIRILERHLELFPQVVIKNTFTQAALALEYIRTNKIDLVFLDIEMPRMTGMDFLKAVKEPPAIIFTTAYRNYAVEAYDMDVVDYLLKPISVERLGRALNRCEERCNQAEQTGIKGTDTCINVKTSKEILRLAIDEILYIESFGDYIIIYDKTGKHVSRERISCMEEQLSVYQFIRIHRQYLVALNKITAIRGNMVLIGDKQLPVGRTYRCNIKEAVLGV
ncbi:response regulator transcription factor [Carboxylicivirga mesophila]|uniref:Response regulator transcription factor n=1 Tax=Carboxylicivirga mesophila TaxID=1166478 RepID=A0ABS5K4D0_9BACT|nr:LytTR family DNA-binding domain-containing protein [Carboxylicivirga mesophila]MBS2209874.1 response regulator transcription factor [Carboxylicivirga mesophila]